jgi:multicomponent Na+:H+ antiporter subunit G
VFILTGIFALVTAPVIAQRVGQLAYRESNAREDLLAVDALRERTEADAGEPDSGQH